MKKIVIGVTVAAVALFALRRFGPAIRGWAEAKCDEMMASRRGHATAAFPDDDVVSVPVSSKVGVTPGRR